MDSKRPFLAVALLLAAAAPAAHAQDIFPLGEVRETTLIPLAGFGNAVDVNQGRLIVGSLAQPQSGGGIGSAWIYEGVPAGIQSPYGSLGTELIRSDQGTNTAYGDAVVVHGDTAVVGDYAIDSFTGAVYVFERQTDGSWPEAHKLVAPDGGVNQYFGWDVDLQGDLLMVSAPLAQLGSSTWQQPGAVYVFERQTDGSWLSTQKLQTTDVDSGDWFGGAISLDGDRLLVGCYQDDPLGMSSGSAYIYERQTDGSWLKTTKLIASDGDSFDRLGFDVSLDGDFAACGAYGDSEATDANGSAYVFERQLDGSWLEKKVQPTDDLAFQFGWSVAIEDGQLLVGSPWSSGGTGTFIFQAGCIYRYARDISGNWNYVDYNWSDNPTSEEHYGEAVAIDNGVVIGGGDGYSQYATDAGRAVVFLSYGQGSTAMPTQFGTGTAGCSGTQELIALTPPLLGADLRVQCTNVPDLSAGLLAFNTALDSVGSDPFNRGILVHLDLITDPNLLIFYMLSAVSGDATIDLAIPNDPVLAGMQLFGQVVWSWAGVCSLPPSDLSSSNALGVTLRAL